MDCLSPIGKEAFALEVGQFGGPIKVTNGYSIFKVTDRQASRSKTFDEVKSTIKRNLETERKKAAFEEVMATLREKIHVDINESILARNVDEAQPSAEEQS